MFPLYYIDSDVIGRFFSPTPVAKGLMHLSDYLHIHRSYKPEKNYNRISWNPESIASGFQRSWMSFFWPGNQLAVSVCYFSNIEVLFIWQSSKKNISLWFNNELTFLDFPKRRLQNYLKLLKSRFFITSVVFNRFKYSATQWCVTRLQSV